MLNVSGLSASYDGISAIEDIRLSVDEREIVCLIGANGAGKTTILRAISGLTPPTKKNGAIFFQGEQIDHLPAQTIARLGIMHIPEGRRIFPWMSVLDNLLVGAYSRKDKETKQNIEKIYTLFPILEERKAQKGCTLSGGEQQMLAIGRALMGMPKLILMDEPTIGLAPKLVEQVMQTVLEAVKEEQLSILLVEQNARLALSISQRAYVVADGRIVMEGSAIGLSESEEVRRSYLG